MPLAQDIQTIRTRRAAIVTERAALIVQLHALDEEDAQLQGQEDAVNKAMLAAVHSGLAEGKTFAAIGAELDSSGQG